MAPWDTAEPQLSTPRDGSGPGTNLVPTAQSGRIIRVAGRGVPPAPGHPGAPLSGTSQPLQRLRGARWESMLPRYLPPLTS